MNAERTTMSFSRVIALAATALLLGVTGLAAQADPNAGAVKDLLGASDSLGLDWSKLFDAEGRPLDDVDGFGSPGPNGVPDYIDWYGGFDGLAIGDNISAGVAVDMSVMAGGPALAQCTVFNGAVQATADLGNSYAYATLDSNGEQVMYVGVEHLNQGASSTLEIEFNQGVVRVTNGEPWPMRGGRQADDLLVRVDITLGVVSAVEVKRWVGSGGSGSFQTAALYGGLESSPCNGTPTVTLFCGGAPPIAAAQEVWDSAGNPVTSTPPDSFFEIGVSVGSLLGGPAEFTSIQLRTVDDIALGAFGQMGAWAGE